MCLLSFALSVTGTNRLLFFAGKTEGRSEGAERTGCWTPFVNTRARITHQPQLRGRYNVTKKEQKQVSVKRFLKKKSSQCRDGSIHADKVQKQELKCHAHSDMNSITSHVTIKICALHIKLWSAYHCVHGTFCSCTFFSQIVHSCIEPSLHGLDFFLEIFLWRLVHIFLAIFIYNYL